jgi:hypothetical protein
MKMPTSSRLSEIACWLRPTGADDKPSLGPGLEITSGSVEVVGSGDDFPSNVRIMIEADQPAIGGDPHCTPSLCLSIEDARILAGIMSAVTTAHDVEGNPFHRDRLDRFVNVYEQ